MVFKDAILIVKNINDFTDHEFAATELLHGSL